MGDIAAAIAVVAVCAGVVGCVWAIVWMIVKLTEIIVGRKKNGGSN